MGTKFQISISQIRLLKSAEVYAKGQYSLSCTQSNSSVLDLYVIQNDCISRLEGPWLGAMVTALGRNFFQAVVTDTLTILTILVSALSTDSPIPPFRNIQRSNLFSIVQTERDPEEMSLKYVGETGYAVFAALSMSSQLAGHEIEVCALLVRSLVGEMDLVSCSDVEKVQYG